MLLVFIFIRKLWWQRAPLLCRDAPGHPLWKLGFFEKARRDGTWDRWVSVILNWHKEVEGLIRALDSPVYALGSAMPPFLLVARLLEPLKVMLITQRLTVIIPLHVLLACLLAVTANLDLHSKSLSVSGNAIWLPA